MNAHRLGKSMQCVFDGNAYSYGKNLDFEFNHFLPEPPWFHQGNRAKIRIIRSRPWMGRAEQPRPADQIADRDAGLWLDGWGDRRTCHALGQMHLLR